MNFILCYLAGVLSTILVYFIHRFFTKLLKMSFNTPIINTGAPMAGPKIMGRKQALRTPKAHTEQMEYEFEQKQEGERRG